MFEHGEALLAPAPEVVAAAVAKAFDRLDEGVVVVGGRVESGHGSHLKRLIDERIAAAAVSWGFSIKANAALVSWNIDFAVFIAASLDEAETTQR
jgi:hypothetical protein